MSDIENCEVLEALFLRVSKIPASDLSLQTDYTENRFLCLYKFALGKLWNIISN